MALTKKEKDELKLFIMETIEEEIKLRLQPIKEETARVDAEIEAYLSTLGEVENQRLNVYLSKIKSF